jgi:hypothetical protein
MQINSKSEEKEEKKELEEENGEAKKGKIDLKVSTKFRSI